jgi:hypothetical protein
MSGGPIYLPAASDSRVVIGMVQSIRGNGIDVSQQTPNRELLFTPEILKQVADDVTRTPCR